MPTNNLFWRTILIRLSFIEKHRFGMQILENQLHTSDLLFFVFCFRSGWNNRLLWNYSFTNFRNIKYSNWDWKCLEWIWKWMWFDIGPELMIECLIMVFIDWADLDKPVRWLIGLYANMNKLFPEQSFNKIAGAFGMIMHQLDRSWLFDQLWFCSIAKIPQWSFSGSKSVVENKKKERFFGCVINSVKNVKLWWNTLHYKL